MSTGPLPGKSRRTTPPATPKHTHTYMLNRPPLPRPCESVFARPRIPAAKRRSIRKIYDGFVIHRFLLGGVEGQKLDMAPDTATTITRYTPPLVLTPVRSHKLEVEPMMKNEGPGSNLASTRENNKRAKPAMVSRATKTAKTTGTGENSADWSFREHSILREAWVSVGCHATILPITCCLAGRARPSS